MKWETVPFGDLFAEKTRNGVYKPADFHGSGVKIVNMGELFAAGKIGSQRMERVELSESERHVSLLRENDLLFARRSLVESGAGKVSIVHGLTEETTFESSIIRVRLNTELCNPLFYYYWLSSFPGRAVILPLITGLNVKGIRGSELTGIKVSYPPLNIQNRISDILSAYDSLIENNQKQIKLLEEAAQRLYKEWFIDLRFPGHESTPIHDGIPEGWEKVSLDEVIEFNPKYVLPKEGEKRVFPMAALSTSSMILDWSQSELSSSTSGTKFSNGDTLLARITPCLENGKTAFVDGLLDGEVATGSTEFIVMQSKAISPYMVYLLARSSDFREMAINSMTGSDGRQRAQVDKLKQYPYLRPSQLIIDQFGGFAAPIFMQIHGLNKQNSDLQEARDRLLPKLMSGEIEV